MNLGKVSAKFLLVLISTSAHNGINQLGKVAGMRA